ncbi:MAG: glycosyltransferase family 2 protein [Oscillospiraceae bacterium]|nr:glycosyltransferase family 2 protein [Oscillospiraceae bacterium]
MFPITVFTATYNRASTLQRAFESLQKQTCPDFIWLVIDDGSRDGTEKLVEEWKQISHFPIEYYKKENGGRHTAVNFSYDKLKTPYVVTLDSDDELLPDAIEKMIRIWKEIPPEEYDRFWCVSGREIDAASGEMVGQPYPPGINKLCGRQQRKVLLNIKGEKHCCRKVDILTQYPFPEYPDVKFVTENTVWEQINRRYDQYCTNEVFGKYYTDSADSLAKGKLHHNYKTFYYAGLFYVNELFDEFFINKTVPRYTVNLSRCAILTRTPYKEVMKAINAWYKKALVTLGYPISALWVLAHLDRMRQ